jgi:hypothetical protein
MTSHPNRLSTSHSSPTASSNIAYSPALPRQLIDDIARDTECCVAPHCDARERSCLPASGSEAILVPLTTANKPHLPSTTIAIPFHASHRWLLPASASSRPIRAVIRVTPRGRVPSTLEAAEPASRLLQSAVSEHHHHHHHHTGPSTASVRA